MGLDCDGLVQLGNNNAKLTPRLSHRFPCQSRKKSQRFAVCYFAKDEIYVAWDLREKKADQKSGFSVKRADLDLPLEAGIIPVKKAIEFYGWGEETVLAFRPEMVPEFLKKYCESAFQ